MLDFARYREGHVELGTSGLARLADLLAEPDPTRIDGWTSPPTVPCSSATRSSTKRQPSTLPTPAPPPTARTAGRRGQAVVIPRIPRNTMGPHLRFHRPRSQGPESARTARDDTGQMRSSPRAR
jgi:hypothetical protein